MSTERFDLIIIGAGVIGHSIAFRLKRLRPGMKIAVLGDSMNSQMASRAAAGMLAPFGECFVANRFFRFCRESLEKYPAFVEEVRQVSGLPVYLSMDGSIMPASAMGEHWEERLSFFREHKIRHEVWTRRRVQLQIPELSESCGDVIWVQEGQVNNRQLHDALLAASAALGVRVVPQNGMGFLWNGTRIQRVVTDSGEWDAERFLIASGSWSQQLAAVLGIHLPLKPIKGQMCRVRVEDAVLPFTVHGILTYIAPWREGNGFVLGSTMEDDGFNPVVEGQVIQRLIQNAAAIVPCLQDAPLIESWSGLRPAAEDRMPIMGVSARYENLYYSTGHFRNGILQTPHQADYLADILLGRPQPSIPEFDPARYDL
ncbi:MAG: glycine oxidase ThiO [Nitrospinaceae bacterium]